MANPGWYQDPFGRFDHRYFDGSAWTSNVSLGGRQVVDPNGTNPSERPAVTAPSAQPTPPQPRPATPSFQHVGNGMAVAALVLGLIGLLAGLVPLFFFIAIPCGILAIVFGTTGRQRSIRRGASGKGMAIGGLTMGVIALVLGGIGYVVLNKAADVVSESIEESVDKAIEESGGVTDTGDESLDELVEDAVEEVFGGGPIPPGVLEGLKIESGFTPNADRNLVSAGALITNTGPLTVCGAEVQFTLVDAAGTPLETVTERIAIIRAGEAASIAPLQLGYQVTGVTGLQVTVVGLDDTTESTNLNDCAGFFLEDGIKLDVQNAALVQEDFFVSLRGQLSNPSTQTVETSYIDCIFKLQGAVVGGSSTASLDPIQPGGVIAFDIGFVDYEGPADEVICTAVG